MESKLKLNLSDKLSKEFRDIGLSDFTFPTYIK
jgi:hypothetical protein